MYLNENISKREPWQCVILRVMNTSNQKKRSFKRTPMSLKLFPIFEIGDLHCMHEDN